MLVFKLYSTNVDAENASIAIRAENILYVSNHLLTDSKQMRVEVCINATPPKPAYLSLDEKFEDVVARIEAEKTK